MKIAITSDIHCKHWEYTYSSSIVPNAAITIVENLDVDVLILAGDVDESPESHVAYIDNIVGAATILSIDGNHEYYQSTHNIDEGLEIMRAQTNCIFHDGTFATVIDDVAFVGANGWYDYNATGWGNEQAICESRINDINMISFGKHGPQARAYMDSINIATQVSLMNERDDIKQIIVFTHTIPHRDFLVGPAHEFYGTNGCFFNSTMGQVVEADMNKKISHWFFGHTHFQHDKKVDHISYMCNPVGYPHEDISNARKHGPIILEI